MGRTVFTGPVVTGDLQQGQVNGPNQGFVTLEQQIQLPQNGVGTFDFPLYVPAGSLLSAFDVDVLTAYDSATSATLSIGATAGGIDYASNISLKTAGRIPITYTAAQLAAMDGVTVLGVAAPVVPLVNFRVVTAGATANGFVIVTLKYAQLTSSN
jgi:hypothetical protein